MTYKQQVDAYFIAKYDQLEKTTAKIIRKYNRPLESNNVISSAYIYVLENEQEAVHFARIFSKSLEHTIYAFTIKFINQNIAWTNSKLNKEANKFLNDTINIDEDSSEGIDHQNNTSYQDNIYNEDFIKGFYKSLNKLDSICFYAFYYEGIDTDKELAEKFNISKSSAYHTIKRLKELLKLYILKHKVE